MEHVFLCVILGEAVSCSLRRLRSSATSQRAFIESSQQGHLSMIAVNTNLNLFTLNLSKPYKQSNLPILTIYLKEPIY